MKRLRRIATAFLLMTASALAAFAAGAAHAQPRLAPSEARAIAKEAYVYGAPLLDQYRVMYSFSIDPASPEYKGPFDTVMNIARVFTPADKAFVSPNSDTPYTFAALDLRAEPVVLTLPPVETGRYYVFQFMDLYTYNFAYLGTRTTGNGGGRFLVAGPGWQGEAPKGIDRVIRSETELASAVGRTQLFDADDLVNVRRIQAGYQLQPLSRFLAEAAPRAAPAIAWPKPLTPAAQRTDAEFFSVLGFLLQFCPAPSEEAELRARFARIGIVPGKPLDAASLSPELKAAIEAGMSDGQHAIDERRAALAGEAGSLWGTRASQHGDLLVRAVAAQVALGANSKEEAIYEIYEKDAGGAGFDGSKHRYVLRFAKGQEPPVRAFWSLTMYDLPAQLLVENPIHRYLVNSPMLPKLRRDPEGGLTIYLQKDSPGEERETNWLPAPDGPFMLALRIYWPEPAVFDGTWQVPPVQRVE